MDFKYTSLDWEKFQANDGAYITVPKGTVIQVLNISGMFATCMYPLRGIAHYKLIHTNLLDDVPPPAPTPPAPVDRTQWLEGIEAVQAYLPCIPPGEWAYLATYLQPLHDGLRKIQHNGPDND